MGSNNIGVLGVLVVQGPELPAFVELLLIVRKLGDMAEHRDLLDEVLKRPGMDREARVVAGLLETGLLRFMELGNPNIHHLLQLRAHKVAERRIFPRAGLIDAVAEGLAKVGELGGLGKSAERHHGLLPVAEVRIVHHIPEVLAKDRVDQAQVARAALLLGQVRSLHLVHEILAAAVRKDKGIGNLVLLHADIDCLFKVAKDYGPGNLVFSRVTLTEELEGVIGLGTLGRSEV
jgi:hypothetical protein